jgi:hypothetical protein
MPPGGLVVSPAFIACTIVGGLAPSLAGLATLWIETGPVGARELLATAFRPVALCGHSASLTGVILYRQMGNYMLLGIAIGLFGLAIRCIRNANS